MSAEESLDDRLVQLETLFMHLQNDVEQLNQVVLEQRQELETLKASLRRCERQLADGGADDRPPGPPSCG